MASLTDANAVLTGIASAHYCDINATLSSGCKRRNPRTGEFMTPLTGSPYGPDLSAGKHRAGRRDAAAAGLGGWKAVVRAKNDGGIV